MLLHLNSVSPTFASDVQNLNIPVKIKRGQLEIIKKTLFIKKGDVLTESLVNVLKLLKMNLFVNKASLTYVYENGYVYPASYLSITRNDVVDKLKLGKKKSLFLSSKKII